MITEVRDVDVSPTGADRVTLLALASASNGTVLAIGADSGEVLSFQLKPWLLSRSTAVTRPSTQIVAKQRRARSVTALTFLHASAFAPDREGFGDVQPPASMPTAKRRNEVLLVEGDCHGQVTLSDPLTSTVVCEARLPGRISAMIDFGDHSYVACASSSVDEVAGLGWNSSCRVVVFKGAKESCDVRTLPCQRHSGLVFVRGDESSQQLLVTGSPTNGAPRAVEAQTGVEVDWWASLPVRPAPIIGLSASSDGTWIAGIEAEAFEVMSALPGPTSLAPAALGLAAHTCPALCALVLRRALHRPRRWADRQGWSYAVVSHRLVSHRHIASRQHPRMYAASSNGSRTECA